MMFDLGAPFVSRQAIPEAPLLDQAALDEQMQRSINSGVANLGILGFDLMQQLLDGDVAMHPEEDPNDQAALPRGLQSTPLDEIQKGLFLLLDQLIFCLDGGIRQSHENLHWRQRNIGNADNEIDNRIDN
jgi:hypothetical protein